MKRKNKYAPQPMMPLFYLLIEVFLNQRREQIGNCQYDKILSNATNNLKYKKTETDGSQMELEPPI